jgi:stage V sporulation protein B
LARLIGNEGIGLYQMAYPVYLIFLSISTAGMPIAISKIVAEKAALGDRTGARRVLSAALLLLFGLGLCGSVLMGATGKWLAEHVVADSRAIFAIWALAPAIFFMSLMAAFRGFFQGWQQMTPSAASQVIEQTVRVVVALILAIMLLKNGVEHAAAGAAFGATMGGMAGLVFLVGLYWQRRHSFRSKSGKVKRENFRMLVIRLIRFTLPISLAVILMPLLQTIDSVIVPAKLQSIGYSTRQATAMLGILGNSWAVVYLPLIVTAAISSNLVPAISGLKTRGLKLMVSGKINEGIRLAMIYLVPMAVMVTVFGHQIYRILYGHSGIEVLTWFGPAILFLGLEQVSAGALQGLGKPALPLINFVCGASVKIIVTIIITGWPGLNLAGAALGTVCGSGTTALLNLLAVRGVTKAFFPGGLAIVSAGGLMLISCWYIQHSLNWHYFVELIAGGLGGIVLYGGALWILGGIQRQDLELVNIFLKKKEAPG